MSALDSSGTALSASTISNSSTCNSTQRQQFDLILGKEPTGTVVRTAAKHDKCTREWNSLLTLCPLLLCLGHEPVGLVGAAPVVNEFYVSFGTPSNTLSDSGSSISGQLGHLGQQLVIQRREQRVRPPQVVNLLQNALCFLDNPLRVLLGQLHQMVPKPSSATVEKVCPLLSMINQPPRWSRSVFQRCYVNQPPEVSMNMSIHEETTHGQHQYFSFAKTWWHSAGLRFLEPEELDGTEPNVKGKHV